MSKRHISADQTHLPGYSAVPVELIKHDLATSSAANRVLIPDCCFSGRAIEAMSAPDGLIAGQLVLAGSYTLTSTSANAPVRARARDPHGVHRGSAACAPMAGAADPRRDLRPGRP